MCKETGNTSLYSFSCCMDIESINCHISLSLSLSIWQFFRVKVWYFLFYCIIRNKPIFLNSCAFVQFISLQSVSRGLGVALNDLTGPSTGPLAWIPYFIHSFHGLGGKYLSTSIRKHTFTHILHILWSRLFIRIMVPLNIRVNLRLSEWFRQNCPHPFEPPGRRAKKDSISLELNKNTSPKVIVVLVDAEPSHKKN